MGGKPVAPANAAAAVSASLPKKAAYTREELLQAGGKVQNVSQETTAPAAPAAAPEAQDGLLKSLIKAPIKSLIIKPAVRAAEALAGYGVLGKDVQRGAEMNSAKGTDINVPVLGKFNIEPVKTGVEGLKQAAGEGLESASYLVGGEGAAAKVAPKVVEGTIFRAAGRGAVEGIKAGALGGAGSALQQGGGLGDTLAGAAGGAAVGGATGGILGGATAAVGKGIGSVIDSQAAKVEQKALLEAGTPSSKIATKELGPTGKVVNDEVAKEVVRQGVPEADVALIKTSGPTDRSKMAKMLDIRELQSTNKRVTQRATDVVGDTYLEKVVKPIETKNRQAGRELDRVAQSLNGKQADPTSAITQLADGLEQAGVNVNKKGQLDFRGSDFEGIKGAQSALSQAWGRARRIARTGDALQMHRAKRYIDEVVTYGKSVEGLSGRAQGILKGFRRALDTTLDQTFKPYNRVNSVYSETIGEMEKIAEAMGHNFKAGDSFANAKVGTTLRRLFSNTQSRASLLQVLESSQKVARKYGSKIDEDIINQAAFADTLEKIFGSEAGNSFQGGIERAIQGSQQAASIAGDVAAGGPAGAVRGAVKAGKFLFDAARGANQAAKIKALRALLNRGQTVFRTR